jgi:dTDP-4-amino-4,6-dideoxygalactose transaminase
MKSGKAMKGLAPKARMIDRRRMEREANELLRSESPRAPARCETPTNEPQVPFNDLLRAAARHATKLRAAFDGVLSRGRFVLGTEVAAFERAFASYCGVDYCIGVASGSDALEIGLRAAGVGAGDQVAVTANAAMYATLAIRAIGAMPLYVDVDPATLTMAPGALRERLTKRTRAVIVTHLYGQMAEVDALCETARVRNAVLLEDVAQAHGAARNGRRAGSFGAIGCFSFYPTKNLGGLGDGGALTTNDRDLALELRRLRQYGWGRKYEVVLPGGCNSRLDELQAAFLRVRLESLDAANARRREIANAYSRGIRHPLIRVPAVGGADYVAHLYVVQSEARDALKEHLARCGVGTEIHYPIPDHHQPIMAEAFSGLTLPVTEQACVQVLSLPCFPELTDPEMQHVIDACNSWTP